MKTLLATLSISMIGFVGAFEAFDLINELAPRAAMSVSDINLRTVWTEAYAAAMDGSVDFDYALEVAAREFSNEEITYTVNAAGELMAVTEWSCRKLVAGNSIKFVNC